MKGLGLGVLLGLLFGGLECRMFFRAFVVDVYRLPFNVPWTGSFPGREGLL